MGLIALQTVLALVSSVITAATLTSSPVPPSQDPFYTAPPGFEDSNPGDILRVRVAPGNLSSLVANTSQAYNILFRTTDSKVQAS